MEELIKIFTELKQRIELLERLIALSKIVIPTDGKLVVDLQTADPSPENGRIYYNTTLHKFRVCENGVWKTITTT
ncbi:MAG: hypothetical protein HYW45_04330 [Candidatus Daviesbacteria bacterium]|nr:MAG: hypothetical protein HYW45_04330 [Candidatus Daviesbacteria bacterium]